MSSPASDAGTIIGSSNLVVSAFSTLILAPVLHGLACLVLIACASLVTLLGSIGLGLYLGFRLTVIGLHGLKRIYIDTYFVHPTLCFIVLPAIVMTATDHGWTARSLRFALYVGGALAAAALMHLCRSDVGLGWLAAMGGLCSAFVFETTPRLIHRFKVRRGA